MSREPSEPPYYLELEFPRSPETRPYTYINMVATIDGKTLSGTRDDHVLDLGSRFDHLLMKRIEKSADAVMVGGQTLRASPPSWVPAPRIRIVISSSGDLPFESGFFRGGEVYVAAPKSSNVTPHGTCQVLLSGESSVDFESLFLRLRNDLGVQRLLVMGGSELNAQLLSANLVDELFVTIAPKIKLGRDVPTYAGGVALSRDHLQHYSLIEHHAIGDEIFIRYRRDLSSGTQ